MVSFFESPTKMTPAPPPPPPAAQRAPKAGGHL